MVHVQINRVVENVELIATIPSRSHYVEAIWKCSFFPPAVKHTIHTNPSQKRSFLKTHFKPEEFENGGFAF